MDLTYREIGYDAGLLFDDLERFVTYMALRQDRALSDLFTLQGNRLDTLDISQKPGVHTDDYIREWAQIFAKGLEYEKSDEYGQHVLRIIDAQRALKEENFKCPKR